MTATQKITDEEKEKRREAVESAYASNRIEGLESSPEAIKIFDLFINGEIDIDEVGKRIQAHVRSK